VVSRYEIETGNPILYSIKVLS